MCLTHLLGLRAEKRKDQVQKQRLQLRWAVVSQPDCFRGGFGELSPCEEHKSLPLVLLVLRAWLPSGLTPSSGRVSHKCHLSGAFTRPNLGPFCPCKASKDILTLRTSCQVISGAQLYDILCSCASS